MLTCVGTDRSQPAHVCSGTKGFALLRVCLCVSHVAFQILEYLRTDIYPTSLISEAEIPFFEHEVSFFNLDRPLPNPTLHKLHCSRALKLDQDERMLILTFDVFGDSLVLGNRDGTIQLWGIREGVKEEGGRRSGAGLTGRSGAGRKVAQFSGHTGSVMDVCIFAGTPSSVCFWACSIVDSCTGAKSGKVMFASASTDGCIRVWDTRTLQQTRTIEVGLCFRLLFPFHLRLVAHWRRELPLFVEFARCGQ